MTIATSIKPLRQLHNFIGIFFAPTILFFAVTGGLQMFGLHQTARGSSYVPPAILEHLSQLHKKGTLYFPARKAQQPSSQKSEGTTLEKPRQDTPKPDKPKPDTEKPTQAPSPRNPLPMKIFFAATALALATSTCTGIMMAWKYARKKSTVLLTIAAGTVLPIILLFL